MSEPVKTHQSGESATMQLECEGDSCFAPPSLSLSAGPLQKQEAPGDGTDTPTTDTAAPAPAALPDGFDWNAAVTYNDSKEFRLDWVRLLQQEMVGAMSSTNGTFDQATVEAIGRWQMVQWPDQAPDGKIGQNTRRQLESVFPSLLTTTLGTHLDSRVLVPAGASDEQKYGYYRSIIQGAGGVFLSNAMEMNLLGIRGVLVSDGSEAHQINGETVPTGTLYQTESAQDFANARTAGTADDHFSGRHAGLNDMMVSVWVTADGAFEVRERMGNVDPGDRYTADAYRTGHLRDGQYSYQTGTHSTGSGSHRAAVNGINDPNNVLGIHEVSGGTRTRYNALTPTRNQEVWRNHENDDFSISENEEATSNERIYTRNNRYVNDNFAMNIHSSRNNRPNSQGCMNIPAEHYLEHMQEIYASSNQRNILYTLIDASKIADGLQMVTQEDRSEQESAPAMPHLYPENDPMLGPPGGGGMNGGPAGLMPPVGF